MTEYDYSPEAYERYLATQRRIANWVDQTESSRPEFANALSPPPTHLPSHGFHSRTKQFPRRLRHRHRSRSPSVDSSSSESYGHGPNDPGPMPMRSAPGHLGMFPQQQMPFQPMPMLSPPLVSPSFQMPPGYYGAPMLRKAHRRSSSHSHSHLHHPPPTIYLGSPPVSPGVYGYPGFPQGQGYITIPQHSGRHMPAMPILTASPSLFSVSPALLNPLSAPFSSGLLQRNNILVNPVEDILQHQSPPVQPNSAPVQFTPLDAPTTPSPPMTYFQL